MSRDKIEEMAINELSMLITCVDIETEPEGTCCRMNFDQADTMACALYNAGYRKQRVGEWFASDVLRGDEDWKRYTCSLCKHMTDAYYKDVRDLSRFCPNCGAKMKGDKNEQREAD